MTHQKIFFCLFQLDRLPKAEVGTDEEKTKLVSQDSKESDVWKKKENNPPKPLEKKTLFSPPLIILQKNTTFLEPNFSDNTNWCFDSVL